MFGLLKNTSKNVLAAVVTRTARRLALSTFWIAEGIALAAGGVLSYGGLSAATLAAPAADYTVIGDAVNTPAAWKRSQAM